MSRPTVSVTPVTDGVVLTIDPVNDGVLEWALNDRKRGQIKLNAGTRCEVTFRTVEEGEAEGESMGDAIALPLAPNDSTHQLWLFIAGEVPGQHWTRTLVLERSPQAAAQAAGRCAAMMAGTETGDLLSAPWPQNHTVHIVARDVWERDAVGHFALDTLRLLRAHGIPSVLYAEHYDPELDGLIRHVDEVALTAAARDVVLIHVSTYDPSLARLLDGPGVKVAYFHDITPAKFFEPWDPQAADVVRRGVAQVPLLRKISAALANSAATAERLRPHLAPGTPLNHCPPRIGSHWLRPEHLSSALLPTELTTALEGRRFLLTVGRLAPNKGHFALFDLFAALHAQAPAIDLVVVGSDSIPSYARAVRDRAAALPGVHVIGSVDSEVLEALYSAAAGVILMSEHEGFCVPVLEALSWDKPLFVRDEPAVAETAGTAAIVLSDTDPAAQAALVLAGLDSETTDEARQRRTQRLDELRTAGRGDRLLKTLEQALSCRVLFNTYPWAFDCPGGGEMQLMNYARHLPAAGVQVDLFNPWQPQFAQVDLVHYFSLVGGSSPFCHFARHDRGLPLVITSSLWVNDENFHTYPVEEIRYQLSLATLVVTNSEMESERLSAAFGLRRDLFRAVYNGVDRSFLTPTDARLFRTHFSIDGPFVLNVGNIEPRKNQLGLVRAMRGHDLPLVLIGQARDQAYFDQVMAEGGDTVRYLGRLEHDSPLLRSAYAACSVFVLPSTLETPGLAALEAAAQGACIAVTAEGSTREYFADHVTYLDHRDPTLIRTAIDAELARDRGDGLRRHIAERFTWDRIASDLAAVYQEAITLNRAGG